MKPIDPDQVKAQINFFRAAAIQPAPTTTEATKMNKLKAENLLVIDFPSNGGRDATVSRDAELNCIGGMVVALPVGTTEVQAVERLAALIEFIKCNGGSLWADDGTPCEYVAMTAE